LLEARETIGGIVGVGGHGGVGYALRHRHRRPAVRPTSATTGIAHSIILVAVALPRRAGNLCQVAGVGQAEQSWRRNASLTTTARNCRISSEKHLIPYTDLNPQICVTKEGLRMDSS
jgi:hypothetical protein